MVSRKEKGEGRDIHMSVLLRVFLFSGAIATLFYFLGKIRKNNLDVDYSLFWIIFSGVIVVVSIFPGIIIWAAKLLGFISPANMVFLLIIFFLTIKLFSVTTKISRLEQKLKSLSQSIAIKEAENTNQQSEKSATKGAQI